MRSIPRRLGAASLRFTADACRLRLTLTSACLLACSQTIASDWPEWRGPGRDGVSRETGWLDGWEKGSDPVVAWRAWIGKGHSAVSISNGLAYTMGWDGREDTVYCLDASTGTIVWKRSYPCPTITQWPGPRSTPTVHGGRLYTLSQHGLAQCFDAGTGRLIWKVQLPATLMPDPDYGFAWSPLVHGDLLIFGGGKSGIALRTRNGSHVWGDLAVAGSCASPVRFSAGGESALIVISNLARENVRLTGVDPTSGTERFRSDPWPEKWGAACVDPVVSGASVFLTTAEQHPRCARFTLRGSKLVMDWENQRLACYTGSVVLVGEHLYGVSKTGVLKCMSWETGEERWGQRGFDSHGALIAVRDKLLIQASQHGDLVVAEASARGFEELRRFRVFQGDAATFAAPVVANGRIYCRSYAGEVVCLRTGRR